MTESATLIGEIHETARLVKEAADRTEEAAELLAKSRRWILVAGCVSLLAAAVALAFAVLAAKVASDSRAEVRAALKRPVSASPGQLLGR